MENLGLKFNEKGTGGVVNKNAQGGPENAKPASAAKASGAGMQGSKLSIEGKKLSDVPVNGVSAAKSGTGGSVDKSIFTMAKSDTQGGKEYQVTPTKESKNTRNV